MLYTLAVCALLLISVTARTEEEYQSLFTNFMQQYSKEYATGDFFGRYDVFKTNVDNIDQINDMNLTFTVAINKFADLTQKEFADAYLGLNDRRRSYARSQNTAPFQGVHVADSIDWVSKGAVTPVKNQGSCGSCWAFSTVAALEGAYYVSKGKLLSFSEQQLVDCAGDFGNQGCNGGLMDDAFEYVIKNGLTTEEKYPYKGTQGTCATSKADVSIRKFVDVKEDDEDDLMQAIQHGPVSIAIEADHLSFQFYHSGVYSWWCGQNLDHGVTLVGYGNDEDKDYWKIKNSWGTWWGEGGFIRIIRGENKCGVASSASYPIV